MSKRKVIINKDGIEMVQVVGWIPKEHSKVLDQLIDTRQLMYRSDAIKEGIKLFLQNKELL